MQKRNKGKGNNRNSNRFIDYKSRLTNEVKTKIKNNILNASKVLIEFLK